MSIIWLEEIGQEGEMIAADMVKDDECIPFPHECHQVLSQELLHIFNAGVLVTVGIGSGLSVHGGLLGGARVVAVCASKAHQKFVMTNLATWLKEKRVVPGTAFAKPQQLVQYEAKKGRTIPTPKQPNTPPPPSPAPAGGTPSPSQSLPNGSNPPASNGSNPPNPPGRSLLASFGNVAM